MQSNKMTTLVELTAQLSVDGELFGVRLKSMFIDPNYKLESGPNPQNTVKFECLCCDLNYVISIELEKEQKPFLSMMEVIPEVEYTSPLQETKIKEENPLDLIPESEVIPEPDPPQMETPGQLQPVKNPFQCPFCLHEYANCSALASHVRTHLHYVCNYCTEVVEGKERLRNHFAMNHQKGFECNECKEVFPTSTHLKNHSRKHSVKMVRCDHDQCSFKTKYPESLRRHKMILHSSDKPSHICEVCGKICSEVGNLVAHIRRVHKIDLGKGQARRLTPEQRIQREMDEFRCDKCPRVYKNYRALYSHRYACHIKKGKRYFCKDCGNGFTWAFELNKHIRERHHQASSYCCKHCGGMYSSYTSMARHINMIHTKIKQYKCSYCPKIFYVRSGLDQHLRTHTGAKYKCPYCPREIGDGGSFYKHKKKHQLNGDALLESKGK